MHGTTFLSNGPPRPLVLLEGYVLGPESGFSDDNSQLAFDNGQIVPPPSWPSATAPSMGYRVIPAAEAFKTLTTPTGNVQGSPPPLHAKGVQLGSGLFLTDRGSKVLPAWLFSMSGVQHPAKVLAVAPSEVYATPLDPHGFTPARLSVTVTQSGRRIRVTLAGAPRGAALQRPLFTVGQSLKARSSAEGQPQGPEHRRRRLHPDCHITSCFSAT